MRYQAAERESPLFEQESEDLPGVRGNYLAVSVEPDGRVYMYDTRSAEHARALADRLRSLGLDLRPKVSSWCG